MNRPTLTAQRLRQTATATLPDLTAVRRICPYTKPFAAFCEALVAHASANLTEDSIILAKNHLQDKFWPWFENLPAECRRHLLGKNGVLCLLQLYKEAYDKLFALEHSLMPRLREKEPPQASLLEFLEIPGIPVGKIVKKEKA